MLFELGFGAKTSSGMGRAKKEIKNAYFVFNNQGKAVKYPRENDPPLCCEDLLKLDEKFLSLLGGEHGK